MFYDAHNHLQDEWLRPQRTAILSALDTIGLGGAVVNGTTEADWPDVAALAAAHRWVIPSYGLHPWFITRRTPRWREALQARVTAGPCAIGEIGLDRWKKPFDLDDQREVFCWQLDLAAHHNLPVTIHCLEAWGALNELLRTHAVPARGFLLHAYGGPAEMVGGFLDRGAYFSFNGYFLHPRKSDRREVFRKLPIDRVLVETDAPAMPVPPAHRRFNLPPADDGTPVNHPANLAVAYDALAALRSDAGETLVDAVAANFQRLFGPGAE